MKLSITADIDLSEPAMDSSFVTWFDVSVAPPVLDRSRVDPHAALEARVALVHVGEMADAVGDLASAMHRSRLESLHDTYFSDGWYKDEYADGAGIDVLYVERVVVASGVEHTNLDVAVVRRLADTLGSSCQLVVMPYRSAHEAAQWGRLGFTPSTPGRTTGLMHMKLGVRHARVVDATGSGVFEVLTAGGSVNDWVEPASARRRACN